MEQYYFLIQRDVETSVDIEFIHLAMYKAECFHPHIPALLNRLVGES